MMTYLVPGDFLNPERINVRIDVPIEHPEEGRFVVRLPLIDGDLVADVPRQFPAPQEQWERLMRVLDEALVEWPYGEPLTPEYVQDLDLRTFLFLLEALLKLAKRSWIRCPGGRVPEAWWTSSVTVPN